MEFYHEIFCEFLHPYANLIDQNLLEVNLPNNIVKIPKNMMEIAKICMNFGGRLSHEFSFLAKYFA